jgi:RNA recognition motif-containing protein
MSSKERNTQIFVAKLSSGVREKDLDYEFRRFGPVKNIQLKRGYAFIEFEDYKDAEDAIKDMDGKRFEGQRIVVQQAMGRKRDREDRGRDRGDRDFRGDRDRDRGDRDRGDRGDRGDRDRMDRRRGPQAEDLCYNCGKTGHW